MSFGNNRNNVRDRNGPNMFTAIQIQNPALLKAFREVQCKAVEDNYYAKNYIVPLEEAHITISVMECQDLEFAAQEFSRVLEENREELSSLRAEVEFTGTDTFGDKVLYVKPSSGLQFLNKARDILKKNILDNQERGKMKDHCYPHYNPHLTMFHIRGANHDGVDLVNLARQFKDRQFGRDEVVSIQLCVMGSENRTEDGYWHVLKEFSFREEAATRAVEF